MRKSTRFLAALLLCSQVLACQAQGQPTPISSPGGLSTLAAPSDSELSSLRQGQLPEAQTRFAFKVFQDLFTQAPQANHFMSPLSLSIALSMLYNGASGETQQEMAQAMQLQGMNLAELNQGNLVLRKRLANPGAGVEILIANALWGQQGITFQPDFLRDNLSFYNAQLTALDFAQPAAVKTINQWASDNTKGKIPKVVEQIDPLTILILMNAIYFKGDWSEPFKESETRVRDFHKADGSQQQHPMMSRHDKLRYLRNVEGKFQAVALPYGKSEQSEMLLILPDQGASLGELVSRLNEPEFKGWLGQMRARDGHLVLPRFKLKTEMPLNATLKRLGMNRAFSEADAELNRLVATSALKPFVSSVKQDAFVEVNEKGTEAAAVTTITVGATSVQIPQEPFEMILDRPFLYAIYDKSTESILFMGVLNEPM
ncbi:MAG: proteinase inhibitor I4 serpin [Candidatus Melainabacteria bacterium HGW-Melainabacteria-1]|nr:MAG: proteinase inhibitor I4 serpin [Candidatus Melainabacteria bacterium HGW-Melainabacteria-1]